MEHRSCQIPHAKSDMAEEQDKDIEIEELEVQEKLKNVFLSLLNLRESE
jgi:hypothetical protein